MGRTLHTESHWKCSSLSFFKNEINALIVNALIDILDINTVSNYRNVRGVLIVPESIN